MQTAAARYSVRPMHLDDIAQVMEVERQSFPSTWPQTAFKRELQQNRLARYLVVLEQPDLRAAPDETGGAGAGPLGRLFGEIRQALGRGQPEAGPQERVVGFIGVWLLPDEAHIVTIAVRDSHRRRGVGELLLIAALELAREQGQDVVTLECRVSNTPALSLYEKYGFRQAGLRPQYYSDNREDAYILTAESVTSDRYGELFQRLKLAHRRRCGYSCLSL